MHSVPVFDLRPHTGIDFNKIATRWMELPRYQFEEPGDVQGSLANKWITVFYTVNYWHNNVKNQQAGHPAIEGGNKETRISYNLVAAGVVL